jgi:hypothetical protein
MKKIGLICIAMFCAFLITTGVITYVGKCSEALGEDIEDLHIHKPTPTRSLMRLISSHTSKILDAIMIGDFNAVIKESNEVAENSEIIMNMFFPEVGKVGSWFEEAGKDPNDPKAVKEMKDEFAKYLKEVIDASRSIAETARNENIVKTYKSFDEMLKKACFACHEVSREKWPNWPDWMRQAGG